MTLTLGPRTPRGAVIRSAVELASDVDGLRLALPSALGDRYRVRVSDDGSTVGLWRLRETRKDDGPGRPLRIRRSAPSGSPPTGSIELRRFVLIPRLDSTSRRRR